MLAAGALLLVAGIMLAAGTSTQDQVRPSQAVALATLFHTTPSPTPLPSPSPMPTATPRRLTGRNPTAAEILDVLFQYPYQNAYIIGSADGVRLTAPGGQNQILIVSGQGATGTDGVRMFPAAFAALLAWDQGEYIVKFKHVEFGRQDEQISVTTTPGGRVTFLFRDIGSLPGRPVGASTHRVVLLPCDVRFNQTALHALERSPTDNPQFACY